MGSSESFEANRGPRLLFLLLLASLVAGAQVSAQDTPSPPAKAKARSKAAAKRRKTSVKKAKTGKKPSKTKPEGEAPVRVITLRELGFKDGLVVEETLYAQTLFFPLPHDVPLRSATLKLAYRASHLLTSPSNFRINVNGVPRAAIPLTSGGDGKSEVEIPIDLKPTGKKYLEVKVQAALIVSGNFCVDEATKGGFLNVLPDSGLHLGLHSADVGTIRAFWELLPPKVTLSLSSRVTDPGAFYAAWMLGATLRRSGREVVFTRLPELGDIVVAPGAEVDALSEGKKETIGNVSLLKSTGRMALGIREPYHFGQLTGLEKPWVELTSAPGFQFRPVTEFKSQGKGAVLPVTLTELGVGDTLRVFRGNAEWAFYQRVRQIAPRHAPRTLYLNVVSTPGTSEKPVSLYVYVNSRLVEVLRLDDHGKPQQFNVLLPDDYLRSENRFRIVAQRVDPQGNCDKGGLFGNYSIQLLPDSALLTEKWDSSPERLSQLVSYFGNEFQTWLPAEYLERPQRALPFLSRVAEELGIYLSDASRLRFYGLGDPLKIDQPFLLVGRTTDSKISAPVRFDKGGVQVTESDGRVLFDVDRLPGITIAQLARAGSNKGLWLTQGETDEQPATDAIASADGDLLFLDKTGALLALDSRRNESARITRRSPGWFDTIGAYRYWLLAGGWLIATFLFVQLYRKVQKHRTAS
jgi:hypothetical protein